eukprot:1139307-Pelagomonas_calceolata.AAC.2
MDCQIWMSITAVEHAEQPSRLVNLVGLASHAYTEQRVESDLKEDTENGLQGQKKDGTLKGQRGHTLPRRVAAVGVHLEHEADMLLDQ